jgi:hypothetical protein
VNILLLTIETVSFVIIFKNSLLLEVKMLQYSVTAFSLTWSILNNNLEFRILSIELREAAEFRDYP